MSQENSNLNSDLVQPQFKEVPYYDKLENSGVQCRLCEFRCALKPEQSGVCRVRSNQAGRLLAHNWGVVSRADIELSEQLNFYHFFPGVKVFSIGGYGQNFPTLGDHDQFDEVPNPPGRILSVERLVRFAIEQRCRGIIFAYNEPTMWYEYLREACVSIKANGMFCAIVSNGYISNEAFDGVGHYIDAMLLQLNAFNERTFLALTGQGQFQKPLETATRFQRRYKGHLEVSTKLVPGVNDSQTELTTIAAWISRVIGENTAWHLSCALPDAEDADEVMLRAKEIGHINGLRYIYLPTFNQPAPPPDTTFDPAAFNNTYCYNCQQLLIERSLHDARVVGLEGNHCSNCNTAPGIRTTIWKL